MVTKIAVIQKPPVMLKRDETIERILGSIEEGGCWVIGTATAIQGSDIPESFPDRDRLYTPEEWINVGNAVVIAPSGEIATGPLNREKGILYAEIEVETALRARRSLDVSGHYDRPDIFSLTVNRDSQPPVVFSDS